MTSEVSAHAPEIPVTTLRSARWLRWILRTLATTGALLLAASITVFALASALPGNVAREIVGLHATQTQVAQKAAELGLDRPWPQRYISWLAGALRGDLGTSWFTHVPIAGTIADRLPITFTLTVCALAVTAVVGIGAGMYAAVHPGPLDRVIYLLSTIAGVLPNFVVGIWLLFAFAIHLRIFPATGYVPLHQDGIGWVLSATLPVLALAVGTSGAVAQQTRVSAARAFEEPYVRTLRARGLPESSIRIRHVLRNIGPAVLAVISLQFIGLVGGTVVIENLFNIPGLGSTITTAAVRGDLPVLVGCTAVLVAVVVVVTLLTELVHGLLDPRIRMTR
ncbi:MAG: ABC transporter permease [Gordonia sp. (in: high G+C Gram-positive bacteria)]